MTTVKLAYLLFQKSLVLASNRQLIGPLLTMPMRHFAVKELPWCAPKSNAVTKEKDRWSTKHQDIQCISCEENTITTGSSHSEDTFGIIAAMDQNRIIGVNNRIPWHIAEDREHFEKVTAGKILIVGKNTFYEQGNNNFSHLDHCRHVITVSSSMNNSDITNAERHMAKTKVHLVRSFNDAVDLSVNLWQKDESVVSRNETAQEIDCWIGGGQKIYEEAIRHPKAVELQLTIVHAEHQGKESHSGAAFFPAKYRYDNTFEEIKGWKRIGEIAAGKDGPTENNVSYSFHVWKKKVVPPKVIK